MLVKEVPPAALAMAPGITGAGSGRPSAIPCVLYNSCLITKRSVPVYILVDNKDKITWVDDSPEPVYALYTPRLSIPLVDVPLHEAMVTVPLMAICHGRSGDKGDVANIGIICRDPKYFRIVDSQVTAQRVKEHLSHLVKGTVGKYTIEGIHGFNFVCTKALDGGGLSSLAMDRQGKCYAQVLLDMLVTVPLSFWRQAKL